MEITATEIARLAEKLEAYYSAEDGPPARQAPPLDDRERRVLRHALALALSGAPTPACRPEQTPLRPAGLISLGIPAATPEPTSAEAGSLPPITNGFEDSFHRGAAASFDLSKSGPAAAPEGVRITARLI